MSFAWLFGPAKTQDTPNSLTLRSLILDQDTVRELVLLVKERTGRADLLCVSPISGDSTPFDIARLAEAPDWEIRRLILRGGDNPDAASCHVDLRQEVRPSILFNDPQWEGLATEVAQRLLAEGTPRPLWKPLVRHLPVLLVLVTLASWVWYLIGERPPLSLAVAGTMLLLLAAPSSWPVTDRLRSALGNDFPGHRIRSMSRQEVRSRRADRHANLKLAAMTVPAGALLGAVAVWLIGAY